MKERQQKAKKHEEIHPFRAPARDAILYTIEALEYKIKEIEEETKEKKILKSVSI